jgi:hypothetical protein
MKTRMTRKTIVDLPKLSRPPLVSSLTPRHLLCLFICVYDVTTSEIDYARVVFFSIVCVHFISVGAGAGRAWTFSIQDLKGIPILGRLWVWSSH